MNMLTIPNQNSFGRLFDELFESQQTYRSGFSPLCDINELDGFYTISFEIPGVDPSLVSIELEDRSLVVKGSKTVSEQSKDMGKTVFTERNYGDFTRRFSLPENVNPESIEAKYKNGVLTLRIAKVEKKEPKRINIEIDNHEDSKEV